LSFPIEKKLVIAVASSALFDLAASDRVFREGGLEAYRVYQRVHEDTRLEAGVAFPLVRRLLSLNGSAGDDQPIEVVLLSRNDPDTGLRVFKSIQGYGLDISRAAFTNGRPPFRYLKVFNAALFLSANPDDVRTAAMRGAPAGQVLPTGFVDDFSDLELRIAFDFDGIIADDSAEAVFQSSGLQAFMASEAAAASVPMPLGPLGKFFIDLAGVQQTERERQTRDASYEPRLRLAIMTARNAPAHERVVTTLRNWGVEVDEVFFLGGIDKARVLEEFRPHIFFDDTVSHLQGAKHLVPCVHVPFGVANQLDITVDADEAIEENKRRSAGRDSRSQ
jgi:5'-nucleotidase